VSLWSVLSAIRAPAGRALPARWQKRRLCSSNNGRKAVSVSMWQETRRAGRWRDVRSWSVARSLKFTPRQGVFAGYKVFDCEDSGENGFVVRLNARFGDGGSVGTWAVVDAWGSLAGLSGAGGLIGDPIAGGGITDNYVGAVIL
jgi:hypothetical protein